MVLRLTLRVLVAAVLFTAHTVEVNAYLTPGESFGIGPQGNTEEILPLPTIIEQEAVPEPTPVQPAPVAPSIEPTPVQTPSPGVRPQAVRRGGRGFTLESEETPEAEMPELLPEEETETAAQVRLHFAAEERREQREHAERTVPQTTTRILPHGAAKPLPPTGLPLAGVFGMSVLCSTVLCTRKKSKYSTSFPSFPWTI